MGSPCSSTGQTVKKLNRASSVTSVQIRRPVRALIARRRGWSTGTCAVCLSNCCRLRRMRGRLTHNVVSEHKSKMSSTSVGGSFAMKERTLHLSMPHHSKPTIINYNIARLFARTVSPVHYTHARPRAMKSSPKCALGRFSRQIEPLICGDLYDNFCINQRFADNRCSYTETAIIDDLETALFISGATMHRLETMGGQILPPISGSIIESMNRSIGFIAISRTLNGENSNTSGIRGR